MSRSKKQAQNKHENDKSTQKQGLTEPRSVRWLAKLERLEADKICLRTLGQMNWHQFVAADFCFFMFRFLLKIVLCRFIVPFSFVFFSSKKERNGIPHAALLNHVKSAHFAPLGLLVAPVAHLAPPAHFPITPESVSAKNEFSTCFVAKDVVFGNCSQCCYLSKRKNVVSFALPIFNFRDCCASAAFSNELVLAGDSC